MKETTLRIIRLAPMWGALLLLSVLVAGCGGRAAMGWSAPVVDDGTLYFASKTGRLYALDVATREQLWSFPSEGVLAGIYSTPVIHDNSLFFGSYEIATSTFLMIFQNQDIRGRAYAIDVTNGQELWHYPVDDSQESEPFLGPAALGEDLVYFTSSDGRLYALDAETGAYRWEF